MPARKYCTDGSAGIDTWVLLVREEIGPGTRFPGILRGDEDDEDVGYFKFSKTEIHCRHRSKRTFPMAHLSSKEALQLAATFALTAEYMRTADQSDVQTRANFYSEQASRAAFLRAEAIAKNEEVRVLESFRRAAFTVV